MVRAVKTSMNLIIALEILFASYLRRMTQAVKCLGALLLLKIKKTLI